VTPPLLALPIDPCLPEIVAALRPSSGPRAVVIEAPPGAGKTTRVPRALLDSELGTRGEILVLQPRRLPARLAAERVAAELGERPGGRIGYTVRFDDVVGPRTVVRFVTEGILIRRLVEDPTLSGVSAVVIDELHERHLAADLALALLRRLQTEARPDLALAVMSATLDAGPVQEFLGDCPVVRSRGRMYDVAISYSAPITGTSAFPDPTPAVVAAVRQVLREEATGDVLVFLPGAAEIRRVGAALDGAHLASEVDVLPLHGDLPPAEQDRAVRPSLRRKVILTTNVAETSVTIDGVVAVVDSGLARIAGHSPWTGLPTLSVEKISQASAIQRAGRAGRTRPGRALRLYGKHDFEQRRPYDLPEVQRLDLAEPLLTLHALGVARPVDFAWFEAPAPAALASGEELLRRLGAIDAGGQVTAIGRRMLRFPLHPRLARLVVEGERWGVGRAAASLAAIVAEGDIAQSSRARFAGSAAMRYDGEGADLLERLDRFEQAAAARFDPGRLRALSLDPRAVDVAARSAGQLTRIVSDSAPPIASPAARDQALAIATLTAFPDRLARRRGAQTTEIVLAAGGTAQIGFPPDEDLLVAVDAEERSSARGRADLRVRLAVGLQPESLLEAIPDEVKEEDSLLWNENGERVDRVTCLRVGLVVLEEQRSAAAPSPEASAILAAAVRDKGLARLLGGEDAEGEGLDSWLARLATVREALPEAALPTVDSGSLAVVVERACADRTTFAELRALGLQALLFEGLPPGTTELLRREAPDRLTLPGGRAAHIQYKAGQPPWIEARLQDFFGMRRGPMVCRGRVALVLHLLAPNGRAVQVTRDLEGFWRQHYPGIRRELMRRYPRHAWPEDGATATPPPPKPRRDNAR
jgi:ATP-dependent helicase HrpB